MKLPFLKTRKTPRVAIDPIEEKLVQGSSDDHMNEHMLNEFCDAAKAKDVKLFRQAVEGLIMNMFDFDGDEDASNDR